MPSIKEQLQAKELKSWRRFILSVVIAFAGIIAIGAVAFQQAFQAELNAARHKPVTNVIENSYLERGVYNIFQVYLDENLVYHFLISNAQGGIVVFTTPPNKDVSIPSDILPAQKYDAACYRLVVDKNKKWNFYPTKVYRDFLKAVGDRG